MHATIGRKLKVVPLPVPTLVCSGQEEVKNFPWGRYSGRHVRVTFKDTCEPDDVTRIIDMRDRGFIKFGEGSEQNIKAVYLAQDGWGNLSRSFNIHVLDVTSPTSWEKFMGLARRLETVELFDS